MAYGQDSRPAQAEQARLLDAKGVQTYITVRDDQQGTRGSGGEEAALPGRDLQAATGGSLWWAAAQVSRAGAQPAYHHSTILRYLCRCESMLQVQSLTRLHCALHEAEETFPNG